jgi:hypothetical protein
MRRLVVTAVLAILLGWAAYALSFHVASFTFCRAPDAKDPSSWIRQEYHLNDAQYARVKQLEDDYAPRCAELCHRIQQSHDSLEKLILANTTVTPEVETALQKDSAVQQECREAMLRHFYTVSQAMPPDAGKSYLKMMQSMVVEQDQTANGQASEH